MGEVQPDERPAEQSSDDRRSPWSVVAITVFVALAITGLALLVPSVREAFGHAIHGDHHALREQLRASGAAGVLILYALAIIHIVIPFPAEITNLVTGFVYGIPVGLLIGSTAWLASAIGTYVIGRYAGRPVVSRLAGAERMHRFERLVERGGWEILLVARIVPLVPYSLVGFVAGTTGVPIRRFAWTTIVGSLPLIALMVVLGSRVGEFSWTDPIVWATLVGFLILVIAAHPLHRWLERRHEQRLAEDKLEHERTAPDGAS